MSRKLENQIYYHGLRSLEDVKNELKQPGDFLVRAGHSMNRIDLVINVLGKEGLSNIVISSTKDKGQKFYLHIQRFAPNRYEFDCCTDLIEFFRVMPIPGGIILKRPIPRPRWLLKRSAVNYKEKDKLGSGNFCDVFKGVVIDSTGKSTTAAIKVCHQEVTNEESLEAYEARRSMLREANLMSSYLHPNVIEFFGVSCDHFPVLVAMEFCPGGSLEDILRKNKDISVEELTLYCFEISRGMRYLHYHNCIHRDLATRNCLISAKGQVKIADFGLSMILSDLQKGAGKMKNVPLRWMAPETLSKAPVYSTASDVWSFGILVYEIFNKGVAPWAGERDFKLMAKKIRNYEMPKMPSNTPKVISKLVEEKIWRESMQRATFNEIFILLVGYVTENITTFPPVEKLVVNQIPGVCRKNILNETKEMLLSGDDKELKSKNKFSKKKRSRRRRSRDNAPSKSTTTSTDEKTATSVEPTPKSLASLAAIQKSKRQPIRRSKDRSTESASEDIDTTKT